MAKKSKSKRTLYIAMGIIVVLFALDLYYISQQKQKVNGVNTQNRSNSQKPSKSFFSLDKNITPTPAWKNHIHPRLKFEILYPSNWEQDTWDIQDAANINSTVDGNIWSHTRLFGNNLQLEIIAWGNRAKAPILEWLNWYRHEDLDLSTLPKESNFTFLEEKAVRIVSEKTSFTYPVVRIFFQKDDKLFEILYRMDSLKGISEPTEEQITQEPYLTMLQNFKFLR